MFSKTAPAVLITPSFTLEINKQIYVIRLLIICEICHKMDFLCYQTDTVNSIKDKYWDFEALIPWLGTRC